MIRRFQFNSLCKLLSAYGQLQCLLKLEHYLHSFLKVFGRKSLIAFSFQSVSHLHVRGGFSELDSRRAMQEDCLYNGGLELFSH